MRRLLPDNARTVLSSRRGRNPPVVLSPDRFPGGAAAAVLDIEDRGPILHGGAFAMRVSNVGVLGSPFTAAGRSNDPAFELPEGSGRECMRSVAL